MTLPSAAVPVAVLDVLAEVADLAGEPSLMITSGARTPRKQVEVMIEYYLECEPLEGYPDCGIDYFLQTYEPECLGDMLGVYERTDGLDPVRREAVLSAMTAEVAQAIDALDADPDVTRACMAHVSAPGKYAVDLDGAFMQSPFAVYHAVRAMGDRIVQDRFFYPDVAYVPTSPAPDAAFHIEVRTTPAICPVGQAC
ncbi:MAG: hypothetical protein WBG08_02045 [Litorimonas sp.]